MKKKYDVLDKIKVRDWNEMDNVQKRPFEEMASEDKKRYDQEIKLKFGIVEKAVKVNGEKK